MLCKSCSLAVTRQYCIHYHIVLIHHSASLDWDKFQWTGIGDEEAIALADPRVIKNFKTLE